MSEIESAFVGRFGAPSELQRAVRSVVREGISCLVVAPPASGKTEAAVIALVERERPSRAILYVCPTRALANDIVTRLEPGFEALGTAVVARHGEARRAASVHRSATCVVSTPESLEAMLIEGDPLLDRVGSLIIDELHSLDGTARGAQMRTILARLRIRATRPLLVVGLSATVSAADAVAADWGERGQPLKVVRGGRAERPPSIAIHDGGIEGLRAWLRRRDAPAKALVFTNSRRLCDEVYVALKGRTSHVPLIHDSDLDRSVRVATEGMLRTLPRVVCITTSTLEAGIDVGDIESVVLLDAPWSTRNLQQRIGRGGRRVGERQGAVFVRSDRDLLRLLATLDTPIEADDDSVRPRHPSVLVQQILVTIMGKSRRRLLAADLETARVVAGVSREQARELLTHLQDVGILMASGDGRHLELTPDGERLTGRDVYGNFPADTGGWELRTGGRRIGTAQLGVRPSVGMGILFVGTRWRIRSIVGRTLALVPDDNVPAPVAPIHRDPTPLVSAPIAVAMTRMLRGEPLPPAVRIEPEASARLAALSARIGPHAGRSVIMAPGIRGLRLLTFAGSRVNALLAAHLNASAGADEVGVSLEGPLSNARWSRLTREVAAPRLADRTWARLAGHVSSSRWFELLPEPLRQEEVTSQFIAPGTLAGLDEVVSRELVHLGGEPVSL